MKEAERGVRIEDLGPGSVEGLPAAERRFRDRVREHHDERLAQLRTWWTTGVEPARQYEGTET